MSGIDSSHFFFVIITNFYTQIWQFNATRQKETVFMLVSTQLYFLLGWRMCTWFTNQQGKDTIEVWKPRYVLHNRYNKNEPQLQMALTAPCWLWCVWMNARKERMKWAHIKEEYMENQDWQWERSYSTMIIMIVIIIKPSFPTKISWTCLAIFYIAYFIKHVVIPPFFVRYKKGEVVKFGRSRCKCIVAQLCVDREEQDYDDDDEDDDDDDAFMKR